MERLERPPLPDTVVVTSRVAVEAGVRPWRRRSRHRAPSLDFWAVGPGTAAALRRAGVRRVHRAALVGARHLARALSPGGPRRIVYFRSDLAGPRLARALRHRGHRVVEVVAYRVRPPPPLTAPARAELARADLLVVTSPSGLLDLRRRLGGPVFSRVSRATPLVVLGDRSRRTARALGFRRVSVAPSTTAQRFTRHLLRELRHARS